MPKRTKALSVLPWNGGLNTSQDEGMIGSNDLVVFNNVVYGPKSSKLKRDGINFDFDDQSNGTDNIIGLHDYWYESGSSKTHKYIGVTESGKIYSYTTSGVRTDITNAAAAEVCTIQVPTKATLTGSQYFHINTADDAIQYYVWVDKSGADSDPSASNPGKTGVRVNVSSDTTAAQVATRLASALDALAGFTASAVSDTVTCTNASNGPASDAVNISWASTTITTTTQGSSAAWTTPSAVSMVTMSNLVVMAATGSGNNLLYWNGTNANALPIRTHPSYSAGFLDPPSASILRPHLGRLFTNDKSNPDRLHYSETFNLFKWSGQGDSGAIDIGIGDGDPVGITAIFPTFQGELFVAKKTKLYRISGQTPDTFTVKLVSDSIGCESHNAVCAVDTDDVYWISQRGIHSLAATVEFGDFTSKFISFKIQEDFNEIFSKTRLDNSHGAYLAEINSVAFAVTLSDSSINNDIYLYNIPNQAWYLWPDIDCEAMMVATDADRKRFYFGTSTTRLAKSFVGQNFDTNTSGVNVSIPYDLETGLIFPEGQPYMTYGFKTFALVHRPVGSQSITVQFKIDGYPPQPLLFSVSGSVDLLGTTFILGTSILGNTAELAPHALSIDGYGRGFKVSVSQNSIDETAEIQGFVVEYEDAGEQQEVSG